MSGTLNKAYSLAEMMGDPCSKQNLVCISELKCMLRFGVLMSCLDIKSN